MLQGSRRAAKAALLVVGLGLAFGSFTANGASAPGAKIRQTDLSIQSQPAGGESRALLALSMDRQGNLYAIEGIGTLYSSTPQQYAVLVFDGHDHLVRRIPLAFDPSIAARGISGFAISPLGDAYAVAYGIQGFSDIALTPALAAVQRFDANGQRFGAPYTVDLGSSGVVAMAFNNAGQLGLALNLSYGAILKPAVCGGHVGNGCVVLSRLSADGSESLHPTVVETWPNGGNANSSGSTLALRDDGGFYLVFQQTDSDPVSGIAFGMKLESYSATGLPLIRKFERLASTDIDTANEVRLFDYAPSLSLNPSGRPLFSRADGRAAYGTELSTWRAPISVERWSDGAGGIRTSFPDLAVSGFFANGYESSAADAYGRSALVWAATAGSGHCIQGAVLGYQAQLFDAGGGRAGGVLNLTPDLPFDYYGRRCLDYPTLLMDADGDLLVQTRLQTGEAIPTGELQIVSRYAGPEPVDLALSVLQSGFGQKASYRYTVKNKHAKSTATGIASVDGAIGAATGVSITLTLGGGQYTGFSGSGWACASADGVHVACDYSPLIAATKSASALTVDAGIACHGKLTTAATVSSNQYDAQAGNDSLTSSKSAPAFGKCS